MSRNQSSKRPLTVGRALALLPLSALTLWGCGTIIGLDSYTVASGGSGGTTVDGGGGSPSAGDSSTSGGKSGAGASTSGGKSGTGGSTTVAGSTSAAGAAGSPVTTPPPNVGCDGKTPFTVNENVIRTCILRAGCSINPVPVRTISECVTKNTQMALPGESCNLTSRTCADYEACEHTGIAHDDLCGGTKTTRCENGKAINCGNYAVDQFYDCTAQGLTCGTYTFAGNSLLYADCKVAVPAGTCAGKSDDAAFYCLPGTSPKPDAYYYCYNQQAYGASCSNLATCYDSTPATAADGGVPEPDATCYYNFPTQCTGGDSAMCATGQVARDCSAGDVINYDCSSVGLSCAVKGTNGYCVAPGCKPATVDNCVESCDADGVTLNFCYGGVPYSVDCTAYGFTSCNEDTTKAGVPYANCR